MMLLAVVVTALAHAAPSAPCQGTLDRTAACSAPATTPLDAREDKKPPEPRPARDPIVVPGEIGLVAAALGGAGVVSFAAAYANTPRNSDERRVRGALELTGISSFVAAGMVASAAVALWAFDPSTGKMRLPPLEEGG